MHIKNFKSVTPFNEGTGEIVHELCGQMAGPENLEFIAVCVPAWTPDCSIFLD